MPELKSWRKRAAIAERCGAILIVAEEAPKWEDKTSGVARDRGRGGNFRGKYHSCRLCENDLLVSLGSMAAPPQTDGLVNGAKPFRTLSASHCS